MAGPVVVDSGAMLHLAPRRGEPTLCHRSPWRFRRGVINRWNEKSWACWQKARPAQRCGICASRAAGEVDDAREQLRRQIMRELDLAPTGGLVAGELAILTGEHGPALDDELADLRARGRVRVDRRLSIVDGAVLERYVITRQEAAR